ncbi:hypothetical protein [Vibrio sp. 10N.261.55.A7]|uniref:hypothetical protein n=1 Tax=Vibrio sp. 10N.261.55.A7 TaxID=1880851 RepID=UPI000C84BA50|nr:hypothetical protein [Vibrio sp. 10N.261.55.A7]PMJ97760.1 hypothetical protein BCU12_22055 [Vibrio sp. 10N.261.55.A7]
MLDKLPKMYSLVLLAGGVFYIAQFAQHYETIYNEWVNWAHPTYDISTYSLLIMSYALAVLPPLLMVVSAMVLYQSNGLKIYLIVPLALLLLLSGLIGKLIFFIGAVILVCKQRLKVANT